MTAKRIIDTTMRALDAWANLLSKAAKRHVSRHDLVVLRATVAEALREDGVQLEPTPKAGDRVRWSENDEEAILTKVADGKAFGPWGGGEDEPESFVPLGEVRVVQAAPPEGWSRGTPRADLDEVVVLVQGYEHGTLRAYVDSEGRVATWQAGDTPEGTHWIPTEGAVAAWLLATQEPAPEPTP